MTVLFIGNFISRSTGTLSVSQSIASGLVELGFRVKLASAASNRYVRFMLICLTSVFYLYDVLHVDVYSGNSFLFARAASLVGRMRRKKVILTLHGGALPEFYIGRENLFRALFKRASFIQSPSSMIAHFFCQRGYNVTHVPNPVRLQTFPYSRADVKKYSILWVRAFAPIYNPLVAVRVVLALVKVYPDVSLTFVGPDKGILRLVKEEIARYGLEDRIIILGPIENHKLYKLYQTHHVYLNTPSYESFGVALVEAASCGIPIVSNNVGEIPYIWKDNESALLATPNDVEALSSCITKIFNDELLAIQLSKNALLKTLEFDWNRIKSHWINLLTN